ncbi:MAG: hypothetical protein JWP38_3365 [Herbaspirillum sp.]|nr:hypothetical protein [Herbaspirillum sp.]
MPPAAGNAPEPVRFYADTLLMHAYADIHKMTLQHAQAVLQRADRELYESWRGLSNIDEVARSRAAADASYVSYDLTYAATLFKSYLQAHAGLAETDALNAARMYLTAPPTTTIGNDTLTDIYHGVLQRGIDWIDPDKVRAKDLSAIQILQTVCRYRHTGIDTRAALTERMRHERDVVIDEAALIFFQARPGDHALPPDAALHRIRARYAAALIDEWQDAWLGLVLLPSAPIAPSHAKFWYDGTVMRNARGKDLETIVSELFDAASGAEENRILHVMIDNANRARYLLGQPDGPIAAPQRDALMHAMHGDDAAIPRYRQRAGAVGIGGVWLTRDELYAVVDKTMRGLALDIHYPIGTSLHAVATIVQRLGPLHGIVFNGFNRPTELTQTFHRLNRAWHRNPHYAVEPSLCAAHYLAQTSDVLFLDAQSPLSEAQQIAEQALAVIRPALRQASADSNAETRYWNKAVNAFAEGKEIGIVNLIDKKKLYEGIKARVDALRLAPEKIRYNGVEDLHRQLKEYLQQRLLAQAPLPVYDENFLIEGILRRKLKMTSTDLHTKRAVIHTSHARYMGSAGVRKFVLTPIEQFHRVRNTANMKMDFNGRDIRPAEELAAVKEEVAASLADDPVVVAKATEILRQHGREVERQNIDFIRHAVARGIIGRPPSTWLEDTMAILDMLFRSSTITSIVNAIASGEPKQVLALLPFVIPLYEIEEGIRLCDGDRIKSGALRFGADALLMAIGAGANAMLRRQLAGAAEDILLARASMSGVERANVDMMHEMAELFPDMSPQYLAQQRVTAAEDTFDVLNPPRTPIESAQALRTPENRPLPLLYLEEEGRQIPVRRTSAGFIETDLRGEPIAPAPPILVDPKTGRGFRLGRNFGLVGGAAGVSLSALLQRPTVTAVSSYWRSLVATSLRLRARRTDVKAMIDELFEHPKSSSSYTGFKQFWQKVYKLSDTAVVIFNSAFDRYKSHGCAISFDTDRAGVLGNEIQFLREADLAKMHYLTPDGLEPFQRERMWVHETTHWLTKLEDPPEPIAHSHRGAVAFMTDRILSELGSRTPVPPRIAYRTPALPDASPQPPEWPHAIRGLSELATAENNYLDDLLDVGREFSATMKIFGQAITDRVTVRQGLALARHIRNAEKPDTADSRHLFELVCSAFNPAQLHLHDRAILHELIAGSKTFRTLAAAWSAKIKCLPVNIRVLDLGLDEVVSIHSTPELIAHSISIDGNTISLTKQPLYYFSKFDVVPLNRVRQYTGAVIDLFLGDLISQQHLGLNNPYNERGLTVLLENEVLQQIGDTSAQRICAGLSDGPDVVLRYQQTINRAVVSENGYLRKACRDGAPDSGSADDDILALSV